ncbi:MAG: hypothetical protein MOGMAGMI_00718 [Candidatus Omnitrophica bacterium]|nr:hypothetical protein [Candidatus Omnitrophota bacterium]
MDRPRSVILSFAMIAAACLAVPVAAQGSDVNVIELSGQAQWRESSDRPWKDLRKSQSVSAGTDLLTGADAKIELAFPGKQRSVVRIGPDSLAQLVSIDPVNVRINQGRIFALVRDLKKGSTFQVSSPTAIASARGTGWSQTPGLVEVFEDTVGVKGAGGEEVEVGEGFGLPIGEDGDLGEVFALDDEAREKFEEFKEDATEEVDQFKANQDLPELDQFDPNAELLDNKDEFDDLKDQEILEKALEGSDDSGGTTGGTTTGGTTGGYNV